MLHSIEGWNLCSAVYMSVLYPVQKLLARIAVLSRVSDMNIYQSRLITGSASLTNRNARVAYL